MPTNQKPGAVLTWGFGTDDRPGNRLLNVVRKHRIDLVIDLRKGRAAPGTARELLARVLGKAYSARGERPQDVYFLARQGNRVLLLGADPVPWGEPRHLEYLLPIAQDAARYVQMGHVFVTPIEVGHIVGSKVLDPLKTTEAAK